MRWTIGVINCNHFFFCLSGEPALEIVQFHPVLLEDVDEKQTRQQSMKHLCAMVNPWSHRIVELFQLEKTFSMIEYNSKPNTAKSTAKPCL